MSDQNPFNVKQLQPPDSWAGSHGQDERGHALFDAPPFSGRAALHIFHRCMIPPPGDDRPPLLTLRGLFADEERGYAPASDTEGSVPGNPHNDPDAEAAYIADRASLDPADVLPFIAENPAPWVLILNALAHYEDGIERHWTLALDSLRLFFRLDIPRQP